jgi:ABC-type Zn uptake system ZnuABC Zn-binding protein ZnuA
MKLAELLRAVNSLIQTGGEAHQYEALAATAERLADMVVWASEPIDPSGQWLNRLSSLQDDLQQVANNKQLPVLMILHDSLTQLGRAISQHDEDIVNGGSGEDDDEYFS